MQEIIYKAPEHIDGTNASAVQGEVLALLRGAVEGDKFVADMSVTQYLSSAGLRVLTMAQKKMRAAKGSFTLRNVNDALRDLLDLVGLSGYLPIE